MVFQGLIQVLNYIFVFKTLIHQMFGKCPATGPDSARHGGSDSNHGTNGNLLLVFVGNWRVTQISQAESPKHSILCFLSVKTKSQDFPRPGWHTFLPWTLPFKCSLSSARYSADRLNNADQTSCNLKNHTRFY